MSAEFGSEQWGVHTGESGWGAVCQGQSAGGPWPQEERREHINLLELKAAHMAVLIFAELLKPKSIYLQMDNQVISVLKKNKRHSKSKNEPSEQGIVRISNKEWDHNYSRIYPREAQYSSGQVISKKGQQSMEIKSQDISKTVLCKGWSRNKSVCHESDNSHSNVVVSMAVVDVNKKSNFFAKVVKPFKKSSRGKSLISPKQPSAVGGVDSIWVKFLADGIWQESVEPIAPSRRQGTKFHCESVWIKFRGWFFGEKVNPFGCFLASVLQFLTEQFQEGREYNTIVGYRSAISVFHNLIDGFKVGVHPRVSPLVKYIFKLKLSKPRYSFIWDVDQVLNYLNNLTVGNNLKNST